MLLKKEESTRDNRQMEQAWLHCVKGGANSNDKNQTNKNVNKFLSMSIRISTAKYLAENLNKLYMFFIHAFKPM